MFRRVMLCAVVVLSLAALPAAAQTGSRPGTGVAPRARASSYAVYYRKAGTSNWNPYRTYRTSQDATQAARGRSQKGWEVEIHTRVTLARVPSRPKSGTLPLGQTVTLAQAQQAYRLMASQRDIAFRFPADGCYARAHLMIRRLQGRGLHPYKVWTFANGDSLHVRTPNHPKGFVEWRYHVAPVLRVRLQNNQQRWLVIDPALCNGPATITTWKNAQKKPGSRYDPYVTLTRVGVAPVDATNKRLPGTGYWPGHDPKEGADAHSVKTMRRYKPFEGRLPPRSVAHAAGVSRPTLFALPSDNRRTLAA
jgi:hypothetical protein